MDRFATEGRFLRYDSYSTDLPRVAVFTLACRSCGFEPDDAVTAPRACPKCHGKAFERYTRPGSLLENAHRDKSAPKHDFS